MPARNSRPVAAKRKQRVPARAAEVSEHQGPTFAEGAHQASDQAALHDHLRRARRGRGRDRRRVRSIRTGRSSRARTCWEPHRAPGATGTRPTRARTVADATAASAKDPIGLAAFHRNGERLAGGSDSGRMKNPYAEFARLRIAAPQNGALSEMPASSPPSAGADDEADAEGDAEHAELRGAFLRTASRPRCRRPMPHRWTK